MMQKIITLTLIIFCSFNLQAMESLIKKIRAEEQLELELLNEVEKGQDAQVQKVRDLIAAGAEVNCYRGLGDSLASMRGKYFMFSPLSIAAELGRTDICKILMNAGAQVDSADLRAAYNQCASGSGWPVGRVIIEHMLESRSPEQKVRLYCALNAFKHWCEKYKSAHFFRTFCLIMKPHLKWMILQENRTRETSWVYAEIRNSFFNEIPCHWVANLNKIFSLGYTNL